MCQALAFGVNTAPPCCDVEWRSPPPTVVCGPAPRGLGPSLDPFHRLIPVILGGCACRVASCKVNFLSTEHACSLRCILCAASALLASYLPLVQHSFGFYCWCVRRSALAGLQVASQAPVQLHNSLTNNSIVLFPRPGAVLTPTSDALDIIAMTYEVRGKYLPCLEQLQWTCSRAAGFPRQA